MLTSPEGQGKAQPAFKTRTNAKHFGLKAKAKAKHHWLEREFLN